MKAPRVGTAGRRWATHERLRLAVLLFGSLTVLLASIPVPGLAQETAEGLYRAALYQEDVQGNLSPAIDLYNRIVADFPSNRSVVANALMHVGFAP